MFKRVSVSVATTCVLSACFLVLVRSLRRKVVCRRLSTANFSSAIPKSPGRKFPRTANSRIPEALQRHDEHLGQANR